ncbi:hypothetical protein KC332_g310 [Hortaea werneckii]|nr:hypothetical protein KC350_g479 [Hortaea werneckii]KAI7000173.1 hypothetical protein KC329_g513 [Hortaea werneckii]KAI7039513.1 hypothetical protein KC366_g6142 [Hortaea werneckii]KAI7080251.1 hypothetical protein KC327_g454 [Hortaea werneckii]KAI7138113.1 hypothetical protein KC337_g815 [Hortaea werneckii]
MADTDPEPHPPEDASVEVPVNHLTPTTTASSADVMNDPAFEPVKRHATTSSAGAGSNGLDTCRICRSEGTPEEPLFYPCKCSGSIKFVHQECLMEWLSHSHKKHCELCKTPFRFTKLYDAAMPEALPWAVFTRRAAVHSVLGVGRAGRAVLVSLVWLVILPWLVRFAWRWMFWFADAGWAREAFLYQMRQDTLEDSLTRINDTAYSFSGMMAKNTSQAVNFTLSHRNLDGTQVAGEDVFKFAMNMIKRSVGFYNELTNTTSGPFNASYALDDPLPLPDSSVLSSWDYLAELTSSPSANRIILDVFEGQLITAVVITGFILVFLIREWVVQQQPLVNLEGLGNVQQQLREAAERVQADNERLRRQQELLEQARRRLEELQAETEAARAEAGIDEDVGSDAGPLRFVGWERLEMMIDTTTESLREEGDGESWRNGARNVLEQIRSAGWFDADNVEDLTEKLSAKLANLAVEERRHWEGVLMSEVEKIGHAKERRIMPDTGSSNGESDEAQAANGTMKRPAMPYRDFSFRAMQVQRTLEEAEDVLRTPGQPGRSEDSSRTLRVAAENSMARMVSSSTSSSSWQPVASVGERSSTSAEHEPTEEEMKPPPIEKMPIANAGPDAKINIKRSGRGRTRPVPEPSEATKADKKKRKEEDEAMKKLEDEIEAEDAGGDDRSGPSPEGRQTINGEAENTAQASAAQSATQAAQSERRQSETLGQRVASAFREEFGLDDTGEFDQLPQIENANQAPNTPAPAPPAENAVQPQPAPPGPPNVFHAVVDWFWGDINVPQALEQPAGDREERADGEGQVQQEALFVPAVNGQPAPTNPPAHAPAAAPPAEDAQHQDPEVLAAAQQAGLDADAVEDAEDLEGVFELVGLQGPLIGLFQTSTFCTILVTGTILSAVAGPYIWGKVVLSFIGQPTWWLFQMPLLVASTIADFVVDFTLMVGGWSTFVLTLATDLVLSALSAWVPALKNPEKWTEWIMSMATTTAGASFRRLREMVLTQESYESEMQGWNLFMLGASVDAHSSLRSVEGEVAAVLNFVGRGITSVVDTASTGSVGDILASVWATLAQASVLPAKFMAGVEALKPYTQPLLKSLGLLKTGSLTFTTPPAEPIDPHLIYWTSNDRFLTVSIGYLSLAALAAVYVAADTPITRSEAGKKTEKIIRDTLRQAGGVLKVILIISIEMLVFPLYCGLLLDIAFLPLFEGASVSTRWAFAREHPVKFCFMHWFVGTCYMFHFALFVGMCRKILRKGVLWFIRDPDDPTFHPVRDVLERNVITQLRKIAFSALVYGALVILCLGGVIWGIGKVFKGIFPIHWASTEPVLEFPMDLLVYNALTPLIIRLFKPSDTVNAMYGWWLRRCARMLRLSHFLFGDRRKDEEGHYPDSFLPGFILDTKRAVSPSAADSNGRATGDELPHDAAFVKDGKFVLTPCSDQYRPPKPGEAFLHYSPENSVDGGDVFIADILGIKNEHFAKIYAPPNFRARISLFMVCLWMFSAFLGLSATLLPLSFGRQLLAALMPAGIELNDIYAYTVGAYIIGGALLAGLKGRAVMLQSRESRRTELGLPAWTRPAKRYTVQAFKCVYVYGFVAVVLPILFALVLQLYLFVPLHTYIVSVSAKNSMQGSNTAMSAIATATEGLINQTFVQSSSAAAQTEKDILTPHNIHILQDYCLGLLYIRLATRFVMTLPASRAAEAFRRITADGYFNPNIRLTTRFLVLPALLITTIALCTPPGLAYAAITAVQSKGGTNTMLDTEAQTKLYRYSYPLTAGLVMLVFCGHELSKATSRWRSRIRDEVYLVGERLHNFGERKPPPGSKSVVRRDR